MSAAAPPDHFLVSDVQSFQRATGASPTAIGALERYRSYLEDWNQRVNLVGPGTLPAFWSRHAWDSAQILDLVPGAKVWADLGSGAGLPGIVLAILGKHRPGFHVHLVESLAKRCRFLAEVTQALALPATVHNARAEHLDLSVDVVTARACAPLTRLFGYAQPYLDRGATGLFLKGREVDADLADAGKSWSFDADIRPSLSDERGRIVLVKRLKRGR